jgi:SAM-dependent methyltransferase
LTLDKVNMTASKPFSAACEENKEPILSIIRPLFADVREVLEIGSGTGQHAVYFAAALRHLVWQPSDRLENLPGIGLWLDEAELDNLRRPMALDVLRDTWPSTHFDAVYSANTAHIMSIDEVQSMFHGVAAVLPPGALFALYGPFNYDGRYTSDSNARFDQWLKARDARSGIKDVGDLTAFGDSVGLALSQDYAMPVNNRLLLWQRIA